MEIAGRNLVESLSPVGENRRRDRRRPRYTVHKTNLLSESDKLEAHGLDLQVAEKRYEPFVEGIASRADLNYLFSEMLGNLVISHLGAGGGEQPNVKRGQTGCLVVTSPSKTDATGLPASIAAKTGILRHARR